jgi:hypothetical protein
MSFIISTGHRILFRVVRSRRISGAGYGASTGAVKNTYKMFNQKTSREEIILEP